MRDIYNVSFHHYNTIKNRITQCCPCTCALPTCTKLLERDRRLPRASRTREKEVDGSGCEVVKAASVLDRGDDGMKSVKISLGGVTSNVGLIRKRDGVKKAIQKS
eukprot:10861796-Ditylum_brightwellii.AAC.1